MSYKYLKKKNNKGFTLIELSIVLVIIGLMLTVAVGLMTSLTQTSRIAKERKQLETIENSLIAYALTRGSLPMARALGSPPTAPYDKTEGYLNHMAIGLSTAYQDSWMQPYQYAVSSRLTSDYTNAQTFCVVLYQLQNLEYWGVSSCDDVVCVTDDSDIDGGLIPYPDPLPDSGYHIAAYIFSTGEDREPSGKNSNSDFEYEMASNPYDAEERDDLVQELTFAELSAKICHARNTRIRVEFAGFYVWEGPGCSNTLISPVYVAIGGNLWSYRSGTCTSITFEDLAKCDANVNTNRCDPGTWFDAKVTLTL